MWQQLCCSINNNSECITAEGFCIELYFVHFYLALNLEMHNVVCCLITEHLQLSCCCWQAKCLLASRYCITGSADLPSLQFCVVVFSERQVNDKWQVTSSLAISKYFKKFPPFPCGTMPKVNTDHYPASRSQQILLLCAPDKQREAVVWFLLCKEKHILLIAILLSAIQAYLTNQGAYILVIAFICKCSFPWLLVMGSGTWKVLIQWI